MTAALPLHRPLIAAVTDRRLFGRTDHEALPRLPDWAAIVAESGVDIIQIRERGLTDATLLALVRELVGATKGTTCRILVNDRVDVALAAGAAGVHLPASGLPPERVRLIAAEGFVIGRSVHSPEEAVAIEQGGGCDYLLFGTVFESRSKPSGHPVAGLDGLTRACGAVALPVLAVGGVTVATGTDLARAGAAGVAAIRLFTEPWLSLPAQAAGARLDAIVGGLRSSFARDSASRRAFAAQRHDGP